MIRMYGHQGYFILFLLEVYCLCLLPTFLRLIPDNL